jgi:hypothetical protein
MPNKLAGTEANSLSKTEMPARFDIDTAKRGIAAYYNVRPEAVEITIRG